MKTRFVSVVACLFALCARTPGTSPQRSVSPAESYPYGSPAFHRFVQDSYRATGKGDPLSFQRWMEGVAPARSRAARSDPPKAWVAELESRGGDRRRARTPEAMAAAERRQAIDLHHWEKRAIPRFSLDRGFEFSSVVDRGERQCLLQSVLLAALLQKSGSDAGAVMVFRNGAGEESNIGHVVTLLKLSNGRDVLTDASHKEPFVRYTGLFARVRGFGYRFVEPIFASGTQDIVAYRLVATGRRTPLSSVRGLDTAYLRSQFAYYRGERTPGGILSGRPTSVGLEVQAKRLRESLAQCSANPISTYLLGRVCLKMGRLSEAYSLLDRACRLYREAGWVPIDPQEALVRARSAVAREVAAGSRPAGRTSSSRANRG